MAASVTVVTVHRRAEHITAGAPRHDGFTATAFLTVSIDPPIVLVSATNATRARAMLDDAAAFAINLLADGQQSLADRFATPHERRGDPFVDVPWVPDHAGVPLLRDSLGAFSAALREAIPAGDHTLFLGDVTELHLGSDEATLVYRDRRYLRVQ